MKLVAAFAYRYEPDWLVDQLRENLAWVDGFAELNTRGRSDVWMPRNERVDQLQAICRDMGADWVLHLDPDERLERRAEAVIRKALERPKYDRYAVHLRELWTPTEYRVDGIWRKKWRRRLYRLGCDPNAPIGKLRLNLYHLSTAVPENRTIRRRIHTDHNTWDNKARHDRFGYLDDDRGLRLVRIPASRGFDPPYREYLKAVPGYEP